ncbi:MAG TPA: hypothetical protein PLB02_04155 [Thermoanaerobaculia bacterium]|nr:hypothetical protein [Thermoanaerobaculia bacterium]HQR66565.1 hypothetical protein [Thermoanaerobaculia bacterium]
MRNPGTWLSLLAFGALLAILGAPAVADDVLVFDVTTPVQIGSLVLEPGTYLIRSGFSRENRNVLTVWSRDEEKFFGYVLANYSSWRERIPEDQLDFDGKDGRVIKAWTVAWKGHTYSFSSAPVSTALASRGKAGSVVAAR